MITPSSYVVVTPAAASSDSGSVCWIYLKAKLQKDSCQLNEIKELFSALSMRK